jgi:hypothetical protein
MEWARHRLNDSQNSSNWRHLKVPVNLSLILKTTYLSLVSTVFFSFAWLVAIAARPVQFNKLR